MQQNSDTQNVVPFADLSNIPSTTKDHHQVDLNAETKKKSPHSGVEEVRRISFAQPLSPITRRRSSGSRGRFNYKECCSERTPFIAPYSGSQVVELGLEWIASFHLRGHDPEFFQKYDLICLLDYR